MDNQDVRLTQDEGPVYQGPYGVCDYNVVPGHKFSEHICTEVDVQTLTAFKGLTGKPREVRVYSGRVVTWPLYVKMYGICAYKGKDWRYIWNEP